MHGIEFHYFQKEPDHPQCQGSLTEEEFTEIIDYLRDHYELLNAERFYETAIQGNGSDRQVCITFDDGLRSQIDVALPCLERAGLTGVFFINTLCYTGTPIMLEVYHDFRFRMYDNVEDFYADFFHTLLEQHDISRSDIPERIRTFQYGSYLAHCPWHSYNDKLFRYTRDILLRQEQYAGIMEILMHNKRYDWHSTVSKLWISEQDVRKLQQNGHMIGLHTHSHPTNLCALAPGDEEAEYRLNARLIQELTGSAPCVAAFPCGRYSNHTIQILKSLGIRLAFTADLRQSADPFLMPRKNHPLLVKEMNNNEC